MPDRKTLKVAAGILVEGGQVLCMQRGAGNSEAAFHYEFPGGKIEAGENGSQALMRELAEEMEIHVPVTEADRFMTVSCAYEHFDLQMITYLLHVPTRQFVRKEHISHCWMDPGSLLTLDWAPADRPVAEKLSATFQENGFML